MELVYDAEMKKMYVQSALVFLALASSCLGWFYVDRAINSVSSGDWITPVIWFFLVFVFISLSVAMLNNTWVLMALSLGSFAGSLFFVFNFWHCIFVVLGCLLAFASFLRIKRDMRFNVKIDLWKSIRMGKILLILSFSLVITSQFYFQAKNIDAKNFIPKLKVGDQTSNFIVSNVLPQFIPGFQVPGNTKNQGLTVDEFILQSQKSQTGDGNVISEKLKSEILENNLRNLTPEQEAEIRNQIEKDSNQLLNDEEVLRQTRGQLSDFVGMDLSGEEQIVDVFSAMINQKMADFLSPGAEVNTENTPFLPITLSMILFLTIISLGSLLSSVGMMIAKLLFRLMVVIGIVKIETKKVDMEIIA